jgi:hypothetical protein
VLTTIPLNLPTPSAVSSPAGDLTAQVAELGKIVVKLAEDQRRLAAALDADRVRLNGPGALQIADALVDNTPIGLTTPSTGAFTTAAASGQITSTVATGTAPLVIASTTKVANLNVDSLDGADWVAPGTIGSTTPNTGKFTTLEATGLITATGGQIKFPAAQSASADANTLDDYEEGTWTPTDGSGGGLSLTVTWAKYVKVGRKVTVGAKLIYPATANTNVSQINGLPFNPADESVGTLGSTGAGGETWLLVNAAGTMNPQPPGGGGITNAQLSGASLWIETTYQV